MELVNVKFLPIIIYNLLEIVLQVVHLVISEIKQLFLVFYLHLLPIVLLQKDLDTLHQDLLMVIVFKIVQLLDIMQQWHKCNVLQIVKLIVNLNMMELLVLVKILVQMVILQILQHIHVFKNVHLIIILALKIEIQIHNVLVFVQLVLGNLIIYKNV